jgi:hypothetical protein
MISFCFLGVLQFDEHVICRLRNKDLDKMKNPVRNFQHHAHPSRQQVQVVETNEVNQGLNARNLNDPKDENEGQNYMHTNPHIAAVPISSSQFNACYQTPASELGPQTSLMGYSQFDCGSKMPEYSYSEQAPATSHLDSEQAPATTVPSMSNVDELLSLEELNAMMNQFYDHDQPGP